MNTTRPRSIVRWTLVGVGIAACLLMLCLALIIVPDMLVVVHEEIHADSMGGDCIAFTTRARWEWLEPYFGEDVRVVYWSGSTSKCFAERIDRSTQHSWKTYWSRAGELILQVEHDENDDVVWSRQQPPWDLTDDIVSNPLPFGPISSGRMTYCTLKVARTTDGLELVVQDFEGNSESLKGANVLTLIRGEEKLIAFLRARVLRHAAAKFEGDEHLTYVHDYSQCAFLEEDDDRFSEWIDTLIEQIGSRWGIIGDGRICALSDLEDE